MTTARRASSPAAGPSRRLPSLGGRARARWATFEPAVAQIVLVDQSIVPPPPRSAPGSTLSPAGNPDAGARGAHRGAVPRRRRSLRAGRVPGRRHAGPPRARPRAGRPGRLDRRRPAPVRPRPDPSAAPARPRGGVGVDRPAFGDPWGYSADDLADMRRRDARAPCPRAWRGGGQLAAFAITGAAGVNGYLQRLAVDPPVQRQGLGTVLVVDSLAWMRRRRLGTGQHRRRERAGAGALRTARLHPPRRTAGGDAARPRRADAAERCAGPPPRRRRRSPSPCWPARSPPHGGPAASGRRRAPAVTSKRARRAALRRQRHGRGGDVRSLEGASLDGCPRRRPPHDDGHDQPPAHHDAAEPAAGAPTSETAGPTPAGPRHRPHRADATTAPAVDDATVIVAVQRRRRGRSTPLGATRPTSSTPSDPLGDVLAATTPPTLSTTVDRPAPAREGDLTMRQPACTPSRSQVRVDGESSPRTARSSSGPPRAEDVTPRRSPCLAASPGSAQPNARSRHRPRRPRAIVGLAARSTGR